MSARRVPRDLVDDLYAAAVETLRDDAPSAAALLDRARGLLASPSPSAAGTPREG